MALLAKEQEIEILKDFISFPLNSVDEIMSKFAGLPNAVWKGKGSTNGRQFVFVKGTRNDATTIVAHADTKFPNQGQHEFSIENGIIRTKESNVGIGADDRAGCAIVWLLKDSGHHLLITDGEENHQIGANFLIDNFPEITEIIHNSSFVVQFDRCNSSDFKCYKLNVTDEFKQYIIKETGYIEPNQCARTDIVVLCQKGCCGVNLSIGYHSEHTKEETLVIDEWLNTLEIARKMLEKPLKRFPLIM